MGSIDTLPAPLPLHIISYLSDLKSLDALRRASPLFAEVFRLHAVEILEDLMRKTLHPNVAIELRAYVLVKSRTRSEKPQTEEEIDKLYADAKEPLHRSTPFSILGHVLREFSNSACICNSIFHSKLERLYSLPHEHFADRAMSDWVKYRRGPMLKQPWGSPYTISILEASPPRWDEEQRMLLAFWRLHLYRLLDRPKTFPAFRQSPRYDTIPAADAIEEMAASVADHSPPTTWEALALLPAPCSIFDEAARFNRETTENLIHSVTARGQGYSFFHAVCLGKVNSPLKDANWKVFRRLGLGIWSPRRLAELELENKRPPPLHLQLETTACEEDNWLSLENLMFTWNVLYVAESASGDRTDTRAAHPQEASKS